MVTTKQHLKQSNKSKLLMEKISKSYLIRFVTIFINGIITIKEINSSQICKFNATENSNRNFLGGGTNKVILKFTGESQRPRSAEMSEKNKSEWVCSRQQRATKIRRDTGTGQKTAGWSRTEHHTHLGRVRMLRDRHAQWGRGHPINHRDSWLSGWERWS